MNDSLINQKQLEALSLIEEISSRLETISYVWGGFSLDIYRGMFLRNHEDIDCLTFNLWESIETFSKSFEYLGWETEKLITGDLRVQKDGVKIRLGNLKLVHGKVQWDHNGNFGFVRFPLDWLNPIPQRFYGVKTYVVEPELEFALKTQPHLLSPNWKLRQKDRFAIEQLYSILFSRRVDTNNLFEFIEGYAFP